MSHLKYQGILSTFVLITIFLALAALALIFWPRKSELNFDFPSGLPTTYIKAFDWPPKVQVLNSKFGCLDAGNSTERAGRTELRQVEGRAFCITEVVEGAAGSTYTQYAYAFKHDGGTAILTFSTRAPTCGNYPEPEMSLCAQERAGFDLDRFVAKLVNDAD